MSQISEKENSRFLAKGDERAKLGDKVLLNEARARLAELEGIQKDNKSAPEKTPKPQSKSKYISLFGISKAEQDVRKGARIEAVKTKRMTSHTLTPTSKGPG